MSKSDACPRTCALKLNIHCTDCERKLKKFLEKIEGVDKFEVDRKHGQVTVTGTAVPQTLINKLQKVGIRAELLWEKKSEEKNNEKSLQIVRSEPIQAIQDQNMVAQLKELSQIEGLEHVEVTYKTTIKMTFKDKIINLTKEEGTCSEKVVMDVHRRGGHDDKAHSTSTCHGHVMSGYNNGAYGHLPPTACTCSPPPPPPLPPPPPPNYEPTAPPEPVDYQYYSYNRYHSPFSEDNPNSCTIM